MSGNMDSPLQRDGEAAVSSIVGGSSPPSMTSPATADGLTSLGQLQLRHSLDAAGAAPAGLRPAASLTFIDRPLRSRLSGDLDRPEVSEQTTHEQQSGKGGVPSSEHLAVSSAERSDERGRAVPDELMAELQKQFQTVVGVDHLKARDDWSEFVG